MRATQAIQVLQELITEHGDLDLGMFDAQENAEYTNKLAIEYDEYIDRKKQRQQVFAVFPKDRDD